MTKLEKTIVHILDEIRSLGLTLEISAHIGLMKIEDLLDLE